MASLQNFYTSRDNNANADSYVGQLDRLWYNPNLNSIYVSDGSTPGGIPVGLATAANAIFTNITVNGAVLGNLSITGNISAAANGKIGGITPGPGVNVSDTGLLTIDSAGLPISFGDFYANVNQLSMVNADEPMYLVSNGTGNINLIGGVNFYKPNGFPPNARPFFSAKNDGQITILIPAEDPLEGGVEIIGSSTGNYIAPGQPGTMLQLTGNPGTPTRMYQDGNGEYAAYVARRWNGNVSAPTQVLAGQDVFRINATAATDAGVGNVAMAQIQFRALEDQTTTAQGSTLNFIVTPVGSSAASRVEVANITVANGVSATKFTTSGNVVANTIVSSNGSSGNIYFDCNILPVDPACNLGSPTQPWAEAYFGPQSVTLLDSTSNTANTVVIQNNAGNVTMGTAGFQVNTIGTSNSIFRIEALSGQIYSAANTIIQNITDAANTTSGSLQTAGGASIAKSLYVGGNIIASNTFRYNIATNNATVTQLTSKSTPVTANGRSGQITTNNASLGQSTAVTFTVNNTYVSATDVIILNIQSGATANTYNFTVSAVTNGSFNIQIRNFSNSARTDAIVINFAVIKVS